MLGVGALGDESGEVAVVGHQLLPLVVDDVRAGVVLFVVGWCVDVQWVVRQAHE